MKKVLTIAGSDPSGGAGIQADLKTMAAHGVYGMSVITALTAQNTTGVFGVLDIDPAFVAKQFDSVFGDIFPDAVKIGMVSNSKIIEVICDKLKEYKVKNIVVDPVMISTSGAKLLSSEAMDAVIHRLIPTADIITPNIPEAEALADMKIHTIAEMQKAAERISKLFSGAVLVKGGHLEHTADDLLYQDGAVHIIPGERIQNPNTHGTGCTLSSAIACNLAFGYDMETSVYRAKQYITGALKSGLNLGSGSGPLNHCWNMAEK